MAAFVSVRNKKKNKNTKKLSQFLKSHRAILLEFGMWTTDGEVHVHCKNHFIHKGSTELQMHENRIFFLPVNIFTVLSAGLRPTTLCLVKETVQR